MKNIFLISIIIFGLISCNDYLDINSNPNSPAEENLTTDMMFPGAEMLVAAHYGNFLRITGGYYAQHYTQNFGTSNYLDYSQFKMSATRSSGTYLHFFRALNNLKTICEKAEVAEEWGTYLAAITLRAFTYQALVDAYGSIPYTEALDITGTATPKYDDGLTVYRGILSELNDALANTVGSDLICTNFLYGSSSTGEWIQFANAVKLKLLMRLSNVQDVRSELAALIAEDNFPTADVAYTDCWANESGKANPFYQEEFATYFGSNQANVIGNIALMQTMLESNDARISSFFQTNTSDEYRGGVSGTNFSTSASYKSDFFCRPVASYDMPVYLISLSEIEFFLAEYHARYGTAADAEAHYQAAIEASFASSGATGASNIYTTEYPWDNNKYAELIGIQKWVALAGMNNYEAWCEMRRLKYPAFSNVKGIDIYNGEGSNDLYSPENYITGTLYTPIARNSELGDSKLLQRFKFAENSANRNENVPANVGDEVPVFWAE